MAAVGTNLGWAHKSYISTITGHKKMIEINPEEGTWASYGMTPASHRLTLNFTSIWYQFSFPLQVGTCRPGIITNFALEPSMA